VPCASGQRVEAVVFEIQVEDPPAIDPLSRQALNGVEEVAG